MADRAPERLLHGPQRRLREFLGVFGVAWEFLRGYRRLHFVGPCVTVFGSARFPEGHHYYELARSMGSSITQFKRGLKDDEPERLERGRDRDRDQDRDKDGESS